MHITNLVAWAIFAQCLHASPRNVMQISTLTRPIDATTSSSILPTTATDTASSQGKWTRPTLVPVPNRASNAKNGGGLVLSAQADVQFAHQSDPDVKIAKLSLKAEHEGIKILSLDKFSHILDGTTCSEDSVELNFTTQATFKEAIIALQWVNNHHDNTIALITHSESCDVGMDDKNNIQAWEVDSATNDTSQHSITLSAKPKEITDVFKKNWSLQAKSQGLTGTPKRRRDIQKSVQIDVGLDFGKIDGNNVGFCWSDSLKVKDILLASSGMETAVGCLLCDTCETRGHFDFVIDIQPNPFSDNFGGTMELIARGVGATMLVTGSLYESQAQLVYHENEVFGYVPPLAGIYIKRIVDIGPTIKVTLASSIGKNPKPLAVQTGFNLSIPDGSSFKLDFLDAGKSDAQGWKPQIDLLGPNLSDDFSLTATVGPKIEMFMSAQIFGQGAMAGFSWAAAELNVTAKSIDKPPVCKNPKAKKGVKFEVDIGTHLDAFVDAGIGSKQKHKTWPLASAGNRIASVCQVIDNPTPIARPTAVPPTQNDDFAANDGGGGGVVGGVVGGVEEGVSILADKGSSVFNDVKTVGESLFSSATAALVSVESVATHALVGAFSTAESGLEELGNGLANAWSSAMAEPAPTNPLQAVTGIL